MTLGTTAVRSGGSASLDSARWLDLRITPWIGPVPNILAGLLGLQALAGLGVGLWEASGPEIPAQALAQVLISSCQALLHVPLFLIPLLLVRGRVLFGDACLALALAAAANEIALFDAQLHAILHGANPWGLVLYPAFIRPEDPTQAVLPQYAKLLAYGALVAALTVTLVWRAQRRRMWLDHLFVLMITSVVLSTTLLYHLVVVDMLLIDARDHQMQLVRHVAATDDGARHYLCVSLGFDCFSADVSDTFNLAGFAQVNAEIDAVMTSFRSDPRPNYHGWHSEASLVSEDLRGFLVWMQEIDGRVTVVVDNSRYRAAIDRHQAAFSIVTMAAHAVWIFGGLGLLLFHRWRFAVRARRLAAAALG